MQRRPTGALPGGRRPYSYGSYPAQAAPQAPQQPQAPQPQYLPTTGMYGSVGMTMSNMDSSLRGGYGQPQQQQQQQQPLRYWSVDQAQQVQYSQDGTGGGAAGAYGKASPSNAGALDLEIGDILESSGAGSAANAGGSNAAAFAAAGDPTGAGGDMFGVANSFQQSPVAVPAPQQAALQQQQQPQPQAQPPAPAPRPRASRSRKAPAASGGFSSGSSVGPVGVKKQPPTAAASSLLDEPPDLSTRKLDDKTEKCQYAGCPNRARVEQKYGKFCNRHVIVAPCGFPGCRDKALDRAAMCERHAVEGKDALHKILAARAQNVPVCRTYGCFKNDQGRGYCRGHEKLLMATGRLPKHVNRRRVNNAYTMCAYPACTKHSQRNHLCRTHGNLVMKQAEELAARAGATETYEEVLARLQKDIRRCSHPACTKNSQRDRLCTIHYYEKHNLGPVGGGGSSGGGGGGGKRRAANRSAGEAAEDADDVPMAGAEDFENSAAVGNAIRDVERTRCLAPGCGNAVAFAGGLCAVHAKQQQSVRRRSRTSAGGNSSGGGSSDDMEEEEDQEMEEEEEEEEEGDEDAGSFPMEGDDEPYSSSARPALSASALYPLRPSSPPAASSSFSRRQLVPSSRHGGGGSSTSTASSTGSNAIVAAAVGGGLRDVTSRTSGACRVRFCGAPPTVGGLCAAHLAAFQAGLLPIDHLTLESSVMQQFRAEEAARAQAQAGAKAAEASAAAAAALEAAGVQTPKKYFCHADGCNRQAQKRGLCKRHFREREGETVSASQKLRPRRRRREQDEV